MPQTNAQEFKITEATIFAERFEEEYNITMYLGELSFFEDLEKPYVTAQIVCMDDLGVFDEIKIRGSEQIRFTVGTAEEQPNGELSFTIVMNIVSIIQTNKVGDRSEIYHINCISPHAYRDANVKISRSYTGKLELIAQAILKNHLDVDVDTSYMGAWTSMQKPVKIITPYISPLESVEWLMNRATTLIGSPFYVWQTIYDQTTDGHDTLRFGNMEFMMNAATFNEDLPLTYSAATSASVADKKHQSQTGVKSIRAENIQDTLKMIHEGAIGSNLNTTDTFTGQSFSRHYSITEHLERLETMRVVPYGADQNVFDDQQSLTFSGQKKPISAWNAREFSTITSYGTYGFVNSYHDVQDASEALNKLRAPAVKSMFNKNMFDIVIPGIVFFAELGNGNSGVSVGDTVFIDFLSSNTDDDAGGVYNEEMSGKYLIHKCRNIFKNTTHEIVVTISKIATKPVKMI